MKHAVVLALLLCAAAARADVPEEQPLFTDDPDADAARRHYKLGLAAYDRAAFVEAIREFELAKSLKTLPALDYNIGRCHERLEEWQRAADDYTRFLTSAPRTERTGALLSRVEVLRARALVSGDQSATAALDLARTRRRLRIAGWALGATTIALAGAGLGAYLAPMGHYNQLSADCRAGCAPEALTAIRAEVHRSEIAAAALWSAAGVALIADVVLWTLARRSPTQERAR